MRYVLSRLKTCVATQNIDDPTLQQILIESIPTMTATIPSNTTPMRDLRRTLDELEDLQSLRTHTVNSALRALTQDDLRPKIMDRATLAMNENGGMEKIEMSIFEEIFEEGLSKFGKFRLALSDSESRQEDLLVRIKVSLDYPGVLVVLGY